jgi:hypothetical protein
MALLGRAVSDGHLFVLAGKGNGTWQVTPEGERWLLHYAHLLAHPLPALPGDRVGLPRAVFARMKDRRLLMTLGSTTTSDLAEDLALQPEADAPPLPVRLRVSATAWQLFLWLPRLESTQTVPLSASLSVEAASVPVHELRAAGKLLPILPSRQWYQVRGRSLPDAVALDAYFVGSPGLDDQFGELFYRHQRSASSLAHCVRHLPIALLEEWRHYDLFWIGPTTLTCSWPGATQPIGASQHGWQCLALMPDPVHLDEDKDWLAFHNTRIRENTPQPMAASQASKPPTQPASSISSAIGPAPPLTLTVISPPLQMSDDGHGTYDRTRPLTVYLEAQRTLSEGQISVSAADADEPIASCSCPAGRSLIVTLPVGTFPASQAYALWHSADPRQRITVQMDHAPPALIPDWLHWLAISIEHTPYHWSATQPEASLTVPAKGVSTWRWRIHSDGALTQIRWRAGKGPWQPTTDLVGQWTRIAAKILSAQRGELLVEGRGIGWVHLVLTIATPLPEQEADRPPTWTAHELAQQLVNLAAAARTVLPGKQPRTPPSKRIRDQLARIRRALPPDLAEHIDTLVRGRFTAKQLRKLQVWADQAERAFSAR